jgi:hypothetical protein
MHPHYPFFRSPSPRDCFVRVGISIDHVTHLNRPCKPGPLACPHQVPCVGRSVLLLIPVMTLPFERQRPCQTRRMMRMAACSEAEVCGVVVGVPVNPPTPTCTSLLLSVFNTSLPFLLLFCSRQLSRMFSCRDSSFCFAQIARACTLKLGWHAGGPNTHLAWLQTLTTRLCRLWLPQRCRTAPGMVSSNAPTTGVMGMFRPRTPHAVMDLD